MRDKCLTTYHGILPLVALQGARIVAVGAGVVASMVAVIPGAPSVIDHDGVGHWRLVVEPCEELLTLPVRVRGLPITIGPDQGGLVRVDNVHQLREHDLVNIGRGVEARCLVREVQRVEPLEQRVVKTGDDTSCLDRREQFADDINVRPCVHRVPLPRDGRTPVGPALVVLGGQNKVLCPGSRNDARPLVGVKELHREL